MFFFFPLLQTLAILQQIHLNSIPLLFFLSLTVFFRLKRKKLGHIPKYFFFGLNIRVTPIFNSDPRYMKWWIGEGGRGKLTELSPSFFKGSFKDTTTFVTNILVVNCLEKIYYHLLTSFATWKLFCDRATIILFSFYSVLNFRKCRRFVKWFRGS